MDYDYIVREFYDLNVIGLIKINENIFKIKTHDLYYVIKKISLKNEKDIIIYETIDSLHLKCFVLILKNKYNQFITNYNNENYYIMPYIDLNKTHFRELKIKFYFEIISYLHLNTMCYKKVNKKYFKDLYSEIKGIIASRNIYYEKIMENFELLEYRSPFAWFYILNYYKINNALQNALKYLDDYILKTKDCTSVRICMNYHNFDYNHICIQDKILISIDKCKYDMPFYDIYDIYQKIPDFMFDLDCFKNDYFNRVEYTEEEITLLNCVMSIVPLAMFNEDEIDNIIKLSRLLYYLDSIQEFINSSH